MRRLKYSRPRFATTKGVHDILEENIGTRGVGSIDLGEKPPSFVYLLAVSHITLHSIIVLIETQCLPDICIYSAITEFLQMDSSIKSFDGSGYSKIFIEKVSIRSTLKGYEVEKAA